MYDCKVCFPIGSVLGLNCHVHSYSHSAAMLHNKTHFNIKLVSWLSPCSSYIFQCGHLKWPFRHRTHLLMYSQTSKSRGRVRERERDKYIYIYIFIYIDREIVRDSERNREKLTKEKKRKRERERYIYIYTYIYAVELKTGPRFGVSSVKNWSKSSVKNWSNFFLLFFPQFYSVFGAFLETQQCNSVSKQYFCNIRGDVKNEVFEKKIAFFVFSFFMLETQKQKKEKKRNGKGQKTL